MTVAAVTNSEIERLMSRSGADLRTIRAAECRVLAALLRRTDVTAEACAALLTNNTEIILAALDIAGELPR